MTTRTIWTATTPSGVVVYHGESKAKAVAAVKGGKGTYDCHEEPVPTRQDSTLPYPWCRDPERCRALGYCPRDPNCGE